MLKYLNFIQCSSLNCDCDSQDKFDLWWCFPLSDEIFMIHVSHSAEFMI